MQISFGGKFANGAVTGGFSYAFNDLAVDPEFEENINEIKKDPLGRRVISELEKSPIKFKIENGRLRTLRRIFGRPTASYDRSTRTIVLDSGMKALVNTVDGTKVVNTSGVLFHELGHMHRHLKGLFSRQEEIITIQDYENPFTGGEARIDHGGKGIWP